MAVSAMVPFVIKEAVRVANELDHWIMTPEDVMTAMARLGFRVDLVALLRIFLRTIPQSGKEKQP